MGEAPDNPNNPNNPDPLLEARQALAASDWQGAYEAALGAVADGDVVTAERLDLLAEGAWWLGRLDECIEHREAAYRLYDEAGEGRRAGRCAAWLVEHNAHKARSAMAGGWLRRARRALADDADCVDHGYLLLRETEMAHGQGAIEAAVGFASRAVELGRRLRAPDLEAEALQALGRVVIDNGDPAEGLALLDEAMLFAIEGRLNPYTTGKVYCSLIGACKELGDLHRAAEWTDATARWAEHHPFAVFPGLCRVHRAMALDWRGALADAEQEATQACTELIDLHVPSAAAAFADVGDIRRRLGDLEGAEEAFARAQELCGQPCAGLALLRLAQGRPDAARTIIRRCLDEMSSRYGRAAMLPAAAQIAVADGDLESADAAVAELDAIASEIGTVAMAATATAVRGRVQLAHGNVADACASLQAALAGWQELDVPYEVASVRTLLGLALRQSGDADAAAASFAAAEALFDQIGARFDAGHIRDLTGRAHLPAGLTAREVEVLRLIAAGRTNKEMAAELFLSEKTVSRHLSNIFTKIGVSSRAAATAFAFEHELVSGRH